VRLQLAGEEATGTVVEDRGPLGAEGERLVRVQLDWSDVAEPIELEAPVSRVERLDLPHATSKKLNKLLKTAPQPKRRILKAALGRYADDLRHVAAGLWPDHLRVDDRPVSEHEVIAVLDELVALGLVVKRPSGPAGFYVSTTWLMEYLDQQGADPDVLAAG
jgi:hypothetical protein